MSGTTALKATMTKTADQKPSPVVFPFIHAHLLLDQILVAKSLVRSGGKTIQQLSDGMASSLGHTGLESGAARDHGHDAGAALVLNRGDAPGHGPFPLLASQLQIQGADADLEAPRSGLAATAGSRGCGRSP